MDNKEVELNDSFGEVLSNPIDEMKQRKAEQIYRNNKRVYDNLMDTASEYMRFTTEIENIETERNKISSLDKSMYCPLATPLVITPIKMNNVTGVVSGISGMMGTDYLVGSAEVFGGRLVAGAGAAIAGFSLADDYFTGGLGVLDDPWTLSLSAELLEQGIRSIQNGQYKINARHDYNNFINNYERFKNGKMPPNEICDFISQSYSFYSMFGYYQENYTNLKEQKKLEAIRDDFSQLSGMLAEDFGVMPDFGDSCQNLLRDISASGAQEMGDAFVE